MARFDLLDEYSCVVVPRRLHRGASGEVAHREPGSVSARGSIARFFGIFFSLRWIGLAKELRSGAGQGVSAGPVLPRWIRIMAS